MLCIEVQWTLLYSAFGTNKSRIRCAKFYCFLEFFFRYCEISSLQQTVLTVVTWRWLLWQFQFLQCQLSLLPVSFCWTIAVHKKLYYHSNEKDGSFPLNQLFLFFVCGFEGHLFVLFLGSYCQFHIIAQADEVSHSMLLTSSTFMTLVQMWTCDSTRLVQLCASFESKISGTQFATNTCCLRRELCMHCRTEVESVQIFQLWIFHSFPLTIWSLSLSALTAVCSFKQGIERCHIGAILRFR